MSYLHADGAHWWNNPDLNGSSCSQSRRATITPVAPCCPAPKTEAGRVRLDFHAATDKCVSLWATVHSDRSARLRQFSADLFPALRFPTVNPRKITPRCGRGELPKPGWSYCLYLYPRSGWRAVVSRLSRAGRPPAFLPFRRSGGGRWPRRFQRHNHCTLSECLPLSGNRTRAGHFRPAAAPN